MLNPDFLIAQVAVAITATPHSFNIPGLDYCHCIQCDRWIATDGEIERLQELSLLKKPSQRVEIEHEIDLEKARRKQCPKQPKISDILIYLQDAVDSQEP
jgi:hypothetical protein